jgi:hypothetical protein
MISRHFWWVAQVSRSESKDFRKAGFSLTIIRHFTANN